MAKKQEDYNPRPEVIDWIREMHKKGSLNDEGPILAVGREPYTFDQIVKEVEQGTPLGKKVYATAEVCYDIVQRAEGILKENLSGLQKRL
ncbi:MAG: hypothetical protein PHH54_05170 [Candidatus Nanoarchaeia archaeon]|nr:hypothetical protein [Candidatus Nanoarchaeia archaeon]MDD5741349.1 hypothetical protein [Candidatus Nanoarchaeia archaeon]